MQWVHPMKLRRVALKLPVAYRCTHGLADDVINDDLGIKIPDDPEASRDLNKLLRAHLKRLNWIKEMRKFEGFRYEQGEAILLCYYDEPTDPDHKYLETAIHPNSEIVGVEAFNLNDYNIIKWDSYGEPETYSIKVKRKSAIGSYNRVVDASRVMRYTNKEIDEREQGYPILAVIYDSLVVLMNIVKSCGEAAFRWGTGHPLILTKNIMDDGEVTRIKNMIGTPTRRSWHMLPSEFIEKFELIGQAGEMLNLKALADIVMEQIIAATKIPKAVFYGEVQVANGEVEDKSYFGLLYEKHVDLEAFIRRFFIRDINIRRLLSGIEYYEIDFGIRQVLNKLDEQEYRQRDVSIAIASTAICTVNECRRMIGEAPLEGPEGELIYGLLPFMTDEANNAKEENKSTKDQAQRPKDLEKNKSVQGTNKMRENKKRVSDAIENLRRVESVDALCDKIGISKPTFYKIEKWAKENE
jgi:hypothetical protein